MKRVLSILCVLTLATLFAACGSKTETPKATSSESTISSNEASTQSSGEFTTVKEGVLTMATNAYFPPYEYYEGNEIVGIDAEIAAAVAGKLGLKLEIEDMEFDSIIAAIQAGKADIGLAGMTVTDERKKSVNFSDSYATGVQAVIVKEDSDITSVDDLFDGKIIGTQLGTTGDIYSQDDFGEDNVDSYSKGGDAVMALISGKVDAVIIDNEPAKSFVSANQGLKILDTEYVSEDYAAALSKGNDALLNAINSALKELKESGELQAIVDKYIKAE